jgi:hypothetical protein
MGTRGKCAGGIGRKQATDNRIEKIKFTHIEKYLEEL